MRIFDSLEVTIVEGKKVFRCLECGYPLGPATENYKNHALRHEAPTSKAQPDFLVPSDEYVLTEYYCPKCGRMLEVDMLAKGEKQIESVILKE
jgi:acetone carboxylase gamma subunit